VSTVSSAFAAVVATDPARPLLTWYDDATGERTELSGATLANWVAKTANMLVDGCGLGVGSTAAVLTPPHWQTAALLLGVWTAGLVITSSQGTASSPGTASSHAAADVAFVPPGQPASAPDTFAVGLHPFAMPVRDLPPGVQDWVSSARVHGDFYGGPLPPDDAPALGPLTQTGLVSLATSRADALGLAAGSRVLITVDDHPDPVDWLLAPIVAGCTLVACAHPDPSTLEKRATVERAVLIPPLR
jgi:uncharacterized protein (TIGR03089 family)